MSDSGPQPSSDPFTQAWNDFFARVGVGGSAPAGGSASAPSSDVLRQMQRAFFDTMARYCDEFMRSEQFLGLMKQTLERSLAFKQQMDQFLGNLQRGVQAPAKADIDDLSGLLRSIEERVLDRLAQLEQKVAAVEERRRGGRVAPASRAKPRSRPPARLRRKR